MRALAVFKDDKEAAAQALGISRRTIYRRLRDYGVT
jgi:transcriptional regulator of acetoin/glycerol metabolism